MGVLIVYYTHLHWQNNANTLACAWKTFNITKKYPNSAEIHETDQQPQDALSNFHF